jgi:membrane-associated phospholipid phosphatase
MALFYRLISNEAVSAPGASRLYAYAGVTLYEAVVNGIPGNYSLANSIDSMPDMPLPQPDQAYDWVTVAIEALALVLPQLLPASAESYEADLQLIADLQIRQLEEREALLDKTILTASRSYGEEIAEAMLEWVATDQFAETRQWEYLLPSGDEALWIPTQEGARPAEPYWGQIRPFALRFADQCAVPLNMPFSTDPDSAFYQQAMEVKNVGNNLTPEQIEVARFWVDTPSLTGTPAGHWVLIQNQMVAQLDLTLDRAAEMYALVGMALADSFISAWSLKYQVLLLRPVTYIQRYIRRSWGPLIETPPFPEYPSGHSVVSAAAASVLTSLFGVVAFTDESHLERGLPPRSYTSFWAAANEAAISRLYGGIHYRVGIENGIEQGRCVGQNVITRIRLRPIFQPEQIQQGE